MLRPVLLLLLIAPLLSLAQKVDRHVVKALQADISYLASDALEGRMTGSDGERKAADYLVARYEKLKIPAFGSAYRHPFPFVHGIEMNDSRIVLGGQSTLMGGEAFPLPFSGNGTVSGDVLIEVQEMGAIWILPLFENEAEAGSSTFDWQKSAWKQAKQAVKDGAAGVVFYDNYGGARAPGFDPLCMLEPLPVPVAFVGHRQWKALSANDANMISVDLDIRLTKPGRTGHNVIAWIDNKATKTIFIGSNYDQLGMAESASGERVVHYGANDNASGTAAVLQLAEWLKKSRLRNCNYVFAHFSGGRLGQLGARAFFEPGSEMQGSIKLQGMPGIVAMLDVYGVGLLSDASPELAVHVGPGFPLPVEEIVRKAGFRLGTFQARPGGSESGILEKLGTPTLAVTVSNAADRPSPDRATDINYPGEARIVAMLQTMLKQLDASAGKR